MNPKIKIAKAFHDCKNEAIRNLNTCFHPNCNEASINSHILQKNGILSTIAENSHVIEMHINKFNNQEHIFKKVGIKIAFSFNCFCLKHDTDLFKSIETKEIDFSIYNNLLLFTLRTIYNEKFRKIVNLNMNNCLIESHSDLFDITHIKNINKQEALGINDLQKTEDLIWKDLNNGSQSYIFKVREISRKDICLSAFYNYETTAELQQYIRENGTDMENVSDIFINLFPYKNKSIFIMGYKKDNESKVKQYVNEFFTDSEKRLERKITNLMMFVCETWVVSNKFYLKNIKSNEQAFIDAPKFSFQNMNERKFFDLNIFHPNFPLKYKQFKKQIPNYLNLYGN